MYIACLTDVYETAPQGKLFLSVRYATLNFVHYAIADITM